MTTGTEGNDDLTNDRAILHEVVDALGGDDTITIQRPHATPEQGPTVTVHGGSGTDSLILSGVLSGGTATASGGTLTFRDGIPSNSKDHYQLSYDGVEQIVFTGYLGGINANVQTGATADEFYVDNGSSGSSFAGTISTGGGADRIELDGMFNWLTVNGGEGDDIIDLWGAYTTDGYPYMWFTLEGGDGNDLIIGSDGEDRMSGGDGDDHYVFAFADSITELDGEGTDTVTARINGYTLGANLENLVLGSDVFGTHVVTGYGNVLDNLLTGNGGANRLYGMAGSDTIEAGAGNDWLDGGTGADTLKGGTGDDAYWIDDQGDTIVEAAGEGRDKVFSALSRTDLGANLENLELIGGAVSGYGNALNNTIVGNALDNALYGFDGNDRLDGGTGADRLSGGDGDDTYFVDNVGDRVVEAFATGGRDTISSSVSYNLAYQHVERLFLSGTADIDATGSSLANTLVGNGGANVLNGMGGSDTMNGGAGDDIYHVDHSADTVIEAEGGGYDKVFSSVTFYLAEAYAIESLSLTGSSAVNGYGNSRANRIEGNANNNVLNGGGGADILLGRGGHDTYYVDNAGDRVFEAAGEGTDTVYASVSFDLAYQHIENLHLTGTAAIDGYGNSLANRIYGNDRNNVIDGRTGADLMVGRGGDDTYYVDNSADRVLESEGGGHDTVLSSASFDLAGTHVEKLILVGGSPITGTGNSLANEIESEVAGGTLRGLGGDDVLSSFHAGGAGQHLYGGAGNDRLVSTASAEDLFYFDTALDAATNVDTVEGFDTVGADQFRLSRAVFTQIDAGLLSADAFHAGTAAADAEDRIVYDAASGKVFYDADGSGAGAAILFAQVEPGVALDASHFFAY